MPVFPCEKEYRYQSPIGAFGICIEGSLIQRLRFIELHKKNTEPRWDAREQANSNLLLSKLCQALDAFFERQYNQPLQDLAVHLDPNQGSEHDRRVWAFTRSIAMGNLCHYGEVARNVGSAAQAVGQALKRNPCMLVTPCHRVSGKSSLGGFMGKNEDFQDLKVALLRLENAL